MAFYHFLWQTAPIHEEINTNSYHQVKAQSLSSRELYVLLISAETKRWGQAEADPNLNKSEHAYSG